MRVSCSMRSFTYSMVSNWSRSRVNVLPVIVLKKTCLRWERKVRTCSKPQRAPSFGLVAAAMTLRAQSSATPAVELSGVLLRFVAQSSILPRAQTSVFLVTTPWASSGAVPGACANADFMLFQPTLPRSSLEMPKSVILRNGIQPFDIPRNRRTSVTRTLRAFRSRWTTSFECRNATPSQTSRSMRSASWAGTGPSWYVSFTHISRSPCSAYSRRKLSDRSQ
mmetsp:Transcript_78421/g.205808  ORF Transcript_78421/g.205808 Transcript_78421/m.205808 type:complete len:222 (+) Transcript_78421:1176-1841(+)